jgi:secreted PhoX family phosphatase
MARVVGSPRIELWRGTTIGIGVGMTFDVGWVAIPVTDPGDTEPEITRMAELFIQGYQRGGAIFRRLEGCWFAQNSVFFVDTRGGAAARGHVWQYVPGEREGQGGAEDYGQLRLVYESTGPDRLDSPDNITVSPRGGLILCEDSARPFLRGLTRAGEIFDFAENHGSDYEFAGACFSPDGETLFVNIQGETRGVPEDPEVQGKGVTLAIWGPWAAGAL